MQTKLGHINQIEKTQATNRHLLPRLVALTPIDIVFLNFSINQDKFNLNGASLSEYGLASFIENLKKSPNFYDLTLNSVSTEKSKPTGIQFGLTGQYSEEAEVENGQ